MKTVLIVEDEKKIREVVASYLQKEGFRTLEAADGKKALELVRGGKVDLVILDLMLPDVSGEEVCRTIRQHSSIPIIMLTAKIHEDARVQGFALGADDYVLKPFSPRELAARVKANIRRAQADAPLAESLSFQSDDLVVHTASREVYKQGQHVSLTPTEYKLLMNLVRHSGRIFTREQLVEKVYGHDFDGDARAIDQHVKNLRQKIETDYKNPIYILTIFGMGYRFSGGGML